MPKSRRSTEALDLGFFQNIGIALLTLTLLAGAITVNLTLKY